MNIEIQRFLNQCKKNQTFLESFKNMVEKKMNEFDKSWGSDKNLNNLFFEYE